MKRPIQPNIRIGAGGDSPESAVRQALRDAAAEWPSGVAAAAVRDGDAFEAITITSFVSVSLEPPLVLMSIHAHAAIVPLLDRAQRWTISILAAGQARAASMIADRIPTVRTLFSGDDAPLLEGGLVSFVCSLYEVHAAGDHRLYLGRVERVVPGAQTSPLLYFRRGYQTLG